MPTKLRTMIVGAAVAWLYPTTAWAQTAVLPVQASAGPGFKTEIGPAGAVEYFDFAGIGAVMLLAIAIVAVYRTQRARIKRTAAQRRKLVERRIEQQTAGRKLTEEERLQASLSALNAAAAQSSGARAKRKPAPRDLETQSRLNTPEGIERMRASLDALGRETQRVLEERVRQRVWRGDAVAASSHEDTRERDEDVQRSLEALSREMQHIQQEFPGTKWRESLEQNQVEKHAKRDRDPSLAHDVSTKK